MKARHKIKEKNMDTMECFNPDEPCDTVSDVSPQEQFIVATIRIALLLFCLGFWWLVLHLLGAI